MEFNIEANISDEGRLIVDLKDVPDNIMDTFNDLIDQITEWNQSKKELETSNNQRRNNKRWKPKYGEQYYDISWNGYVNEYTWRDFNNTSSSFALSNIFKTREEAEFELERRKVMVELEDYAREHNDKMDWNNDCQTKYYIGFINNEEKEIYIGQALLCKIFGVIYFSSEEITQKAIRAVGKDRIKKYLSNVK